MYANVYASLKRLVPSMLLFLFVPVHLPAQPENSYTHAALAEKIYLQLDGKVYTTDKTIWFKAIVTGAADHSPTPLSGVLYVELIGPDEKIIEKKLIKLEKGIGKGFFQLNPNYAEGSYLIRAYTAWNKNFGTDFFFKEYIRVFDASAKEKTDPISQVILVEKPHNERRLNAFLDPLILDNHHKKELTLIITLDNKKDTLPVNKGADGKYLIDYAIPDECRFVTLQIQTKNLVTYTKTIALDKDDTDLRFFPEGGELVHGIPGKVGFKAVDYSGKGKSVEGEIVTGKGERITSFKSNQLGMGSFTLVIPDSAATYFAKTRSPSDEKLSLMYPLPAVTPLGNVLSVIKRENGMRIAVASNYLKNDSVYVRISCRGVAYYDIKGPLKEGVLSFELQANDFPEGIIAFTLMDPLMHPVAERLYFNQRPDSRLNITISADKDTFMQRERTTLNIDTGNKGEVVNTSLSVLVLNKEQMGQIQTARQNILSYFLLSSDLKGAIEDPGFYFRKDQDRFDDLDALLLTQGWRKYNYTKLPEKILCRPEPMLTVSGTVGGVIFQDKKKEVELTMMTFGENQSVQTQRTDSLGRFYFNVNDEYGQNLNILIQSTNKLGKKKDYTVVLDKKESPPVSFDHVRSIERVDSTVHTLVEKNIARKAVEDAFPLAKGDILLGEVVVEGYRMSPERQKVMDQYGKPDVVIEGNLIQEKEEKWSYGLYSVLLFNFPDKVIIQRGADGNLYARVNYSEMTLVVIDGVPVRDYEYPLIPNIPPGEVSSFEIIEHAKNFSKLYLEAYPQASPMDAPAWGDVIAIYTYGRKGIYGAHTPVGILQAAVPVFSVSKEFYVPTYENLKPDDWFKPDLRALVHWEPALKPDPTGRTSATFYNADIPGEMLVVVEGISDNGEIGYQEFIYHVKKREIISDF